MINSKTFLRFFCVAVIPLILAGCSASKEEVVTSTQPNDLYNDGVALLNKGKFMDAISKFETLEREHPESDLAAQAQIRRSFSYYEEGNFVLATLTIDEFVKQYPRHSSTPYMYYLKGLCFYDQIVDPGRDQELTHEAIKAFQDLLNRYPESVYSKDAKFKMEYALNNLAGKEMDIGSFYQNKKQLVSALNRYKNVVDNFQTSIFIPEALYRLVEIYYALGDLEQSQNYAAVLGHNYPQNEWYEKAYALIVDKTYVEQTPWYKKSLKNIW